MLVKQFFRNIGSSLRCSAAAFKKCISQYNNQLYTWQFLLRWHIWACLIITLLVPTKMSLLGLTLLLREKLREWIVYDLLEAYIDSLFLIRKQNRESCIKMSNNRQCSILKYTLVKVCLLGKLRLYCSRPKCEG